MSSGTERRRTGTPRMRRGVAAASVAVIALIGGLLGAPAAAAQDCAGSVDASLTSPDLPGGTWTVTDGCLTSDLFYEYRDGDAHAQAAIAQVTYDDGHVGRVAVGTLTFGTGIALGVVGVEDAATGLVKWSAVLAPLDSSGATSTVQGEGVTLFPTDPAAVALSITGVGTDARTLMTTTTTVPGTTPPGPQELPAADEGTPEPPPTTVAPDTVPTSVPGSDTVATTTTSIAPPTTLAEDPAP
ncbi:MAG: hypothetical protein ACYC2O_00500 [Microthrixaceae bacterium]